VIIEEIAYAPFKGHPRFQQCLLGGRIVLMHDKQRQRDNEGRFLLAMSTFVTTARKP